MLLLERQLSRSRLPRLQGRRNGQLLQHTLLPFHAVWEVIRRPSDILQYAFEERLTMSSGGVGELDAIVASGAEPRSYIAREGHVRAVDNSEEKDGVRR